MCNIRILLCNQFQIKNHRERVQFCKETQTFVKVVEPEAMRIWRTRLWKRNIDSSSTRRKH